MKVCSLPKVLLPRLYGAWVIEEDLEGEHPHLGLDQHRPLSGPLAVAVLGITAEDRPAVTSASGIHLWSSPALPGGAAASWGRTPETTCCCGYSRPAAAVSGSAAVYHERQADRNNARQL